MPALFVFLLKINAALILFCLGYYLVLRRLTFYTLNRIYLFIAIIFSSAYPLINLNNFAEQHKEIAVPVQTVVLRLEYPAAALVQRPDYWGLATLFFWIGAALFAIRLAIQLIALYKIYRGSRPGTVDNHPVRIIDADVSPFSFWQSIYINPENLNPADLKSVLQHEQVHVKEWHTLDILLTEISVIFYWFNPGVWLMKKAVRENIEFITDRKILQQGIDSKQYQYSLLNVSFAATAPAGITNNFNFSTLKKRIVMMNARRSSEVNLARYVILIPIVLTGLLAFSFKTELAKPVNKVYKTITSSVSNLNVITTIKRESNIITDKKSDYQTKIMHALSQTLGIGADTGKNLTIKSSLGEINVPFGFFLKNIPAQQIDIKNLHNDTIKNVGTANKQQNYYLFTDTDKKTKQITFSFRADTNKKNAIRVTTLSSNPGSQIDIRGFHADTNKKKTYRLGGGPGQADIRGYYSDKAPPLFIIDGVQKTRDDFARLNPNEIESFSVLKDATSAIYGEKAANGVILVITKNNPMANIINSLQAQRAAAANKDKIETVNLEDGSAKKLILINGAVASEKERDKLPLSAIKSIRVTSDKDKEINDQYGEKAKNGIIFITTKNAGN